MCYNFSRKCGRHVGGRRILFTLLNLVQPVTVDEAYQILMEKRNNVILGGCAFLRLSSRKISTGVELSKLNLNYITEHDDDVEIGAMTTFRDLETSALLQQYFNGVLPKAVSNIIGVQFRNVVTVGASVYAKYGFSDLLTALLSLDTEVELYKGGRMPLQQFLEQPYEKDLLTRIFIKKEQRQAAYENFRNSASDFPLVNVAVSHVDNQWKIVVGATPERAKCAKQAATALNNGNKNLDEIAGIATEELVFGTNARATAEYRKAICQVLIKRAIEEVAPWK